MSADLLSAEKAPFIAALFFSIVAWSVNGAISELNGRKVVQYSTTVKHSKPDSKFTVQIKNLSAKNAIMGAAYRITPAKGKSLTSLPNGNRGDIAFLGNVDVRHQSNDGSVTSGAQFYLPVFPPGAEFELFAKFPHADPAPSFDAYYFVKETTDTMAVDADMRIISSCSLEAFLLRNQLGIYFGLLLVSFGLIALWVLFALGVSGKTGQSGRGP